jgi:hypothetical protein
MLGVALLGWSSMYAMLPWSMNGFFFALSLDERRNDVENERTRKDQDFSPTRITCLWEQMARCVEGGVSKEADRADDWSAPEEQ